MYYGKWDFLLKLLLYSLHRNKEKYLFKIEFKKNILSYSLNSIISMKK